MNPPRLTSRKWLCRIVAFGVLNAAPLCAQDMPVASPTATATPEATATLATVTPSPVPSVSPAGSPRVLYPSANPVGGANAALGNGTGTTGLATTFLVLLGLCAGAYYLSRRHPGLAAGLKGAPRKLNLSESRSLGNRQFLVVVEYENERMLLGVTPGKIDYLCPLRGPHGEFSAFPAPKE